MCESGQNSDADRVIFQKIGSSALSARQLDLLTHAQIREFLNVQVKEE